MTIFDTICKWTQDERESHKELIMECLKREMQIAVNFNLSEKGIKRIHDHCLGEFIAMRVKRWYSA